MKLCILRVLVLTCVFTPAFGQELKHLSLDRPSELGLIIESDPAVKAEGQASIKIQTDWSTTVCLGQVSGLAVDNAKLVYSAKVRSDLKGSAYLEMWVRVNGKEFFSRGMNSTISGNSPWKTIEAPFFVEGGQQVDRVTLNLIINGSGTVWIDDASLSKAPLR